MWINKGHGRSPMMEQLKEDSNLDTCNIEPFLTAAYDCNLHQFSNEKIKGRSKL